MEIMECVYGFREDRFDWAFLWSAALLIGSIMGRHHGRHHGVGSCPASTHLRSTEYVVLEQGHGRDGTRLARQSWSREHGTGVAAAAALAWPCSVFINSHNGLRTP